MALVTVSSKILVSVYLFLRFWRTRAEPVYEDSEEDDQVLGNGRLLPSGEAHHFSKTDLRRDRQECEQGERVVPEADRL